MEKWDLYDQYRTKLEKQATRGDDLEIGEYHLVVHACIFNSKGELLIQQRQPFKESWQNMWDLTCGGSAIAGDTSQQAMRRELKEELGIDYDFQQLRPIFTINFPRGFDDYYVIKMDVDLEKVVLQPEEVKAVKWATKEEVLLMIGEGTFIPYYESLISFIFDSYLNLGSGSVARKRNT